MSSRSRSASIVALLGRRRELSTADFDLRSITPLATTQSRGINHLARDDVEYNSHGAHHGEHSVGDLSDPRANVCSCEEICPSLSKRDAWPAAARLSGPRPHGTR